MKGDVFMDKFAKIAQNKIVPRDEIYEVVPEKLNEFKIPLKPTTQNKTRYEKKPSTKEELAQILYQEKKNYSKYLQDIAPKFEPLRENILLTEFILDGAEKITLPHYGGPTGYAKKVYETQFFIKEKNNDKTYNICFSGVDYIATVYINGTCVGKHEGFFAPFYFDISAVVQQGKNELKVEVENDYSYMGNMEEPEVGHGDKLYAATGLGWDDSELGWHHCPPGMGIYGSVKVEICNRIYISDLYVRTILEEERAELWVDVYNSDYTDDLPEISVSIFGQNFSAEVIKDKVYKTTTKNFSNGGLLCDVNEEDGHKLPLRKGVNTYRISVNIPSPVQWSITEPYLYQAQVSVMMNGAVLDRMKNQFGMRSFYQATVSEKKGMFYLNGEKIRLRGANTMGFEQWDVLKGDFDQLIEDILLAKICNMNFLRLTQRPVQDEIYEYCDKLGLMTQTDLPLFGVMRRTKFAEGVRQAEEMEKMVRNHPCNIIVSLINEPSPYGLNQPHRHMQRNELENFFKACEYIIKLNNPERVLKYVDGDYDPPSDNMPDYHCYNLWYNGHLIDIGKMIKGYWGQVKPNWYYGCGEFGSEGLDFPEIMREYYPREWISEPFNPKNIVRAQTGDFHEFFYPRQKTLEEWVYQSQRHQAESIKMMTEIFRRNNDMATFAIHLFIDAWPSGWLKTIMDFKRNPKPAYFEYRNALEPVMLSLRTDRFTYFAGEEIRIETYLCNDTNKQLEYEIIYELTNEKGELLKSATLRTKSLPMQSIYIGSPEFIIDEVSDREKFILTAFLKSNGKIITYNSESIEVFERYEETSQPENVIWVNDLEVGEYEIAGEKIVVTPSPMNHMHFVSLSEDHEINNYFKEFDFRYWYDKEMGYISPIAKRTFSCDGFTPVLNGASGEKAANPSGEESTKKLKGYVVAEKVYEGKRYIINMLDLRTENPVAQRFVNYMNSKC